MIQDFCLLVGFGVYRPFFQTNVELFRHLLPDSCCCTVELKDKSKQAPVKLNNIFTQRHIAKHTLYEWSLISARDKRAKQNPRTRAKLERRGACRSYDPRVSRVGRVIFCPHSCLSPMTSRCQCQTQGWMPERPNNSRCPFFNCCHLCFSQCASATLYKMLRLILLHHN